jgi:L-ascorbate metabolism protein UlaG (beta-lactamase superfamily)
MDHLDLPSLRRINRDAAVVTAHSTQDIFRSVPFRAVTELAWNEQAEVATEDGEVTVAAFRLRHWGARLQRDEHRRYNAYLLERNGVRLCFMGDTAYIDARHLSSRGPIDLMIVPIGAYQPWIRAHCTPEQAVAMADEAGARFLIPVHHQTFKLSWEPMDEPIARFVAALENARERIALTRIGETFVLPEARSGTL